MAAAICPHGMGRSPPEQIRAARRQHAHQLRAVRAVTCEVHNLRVVVVRAAGSIPHHVPWLSPPHLGGLCVAMPPALHGLEGVEARLLGEARGPQLDGGGALVAGPLGLQQQVEGVHAANVDLAEAARQEDVLLPVFLRDAAAVVPCVVVDAQGVAVEDLDRPVQAELAVVQDHGVVHHASGLPALQHGLEAVGEEDGVRVDLHDPVVPPGPGVFDEPVPVAAEDWRVQSRVVLAPDMSCQRPVHDVTLDVLLPLGAVLQHHAPVAVDGPLVAGEDPDLHVLRRQVGPEHVDLVGPPQHQRGAEERGVDLGLLLLLLVVLGVVCLLRLGRRRILKHEGLARLLRIPHALGENQVAPGMGVAGFGVQAFCTRRRRLEHPLAPVRELEPLLVRALLARLEAQLTGEGCAQALARLGHHFDVAGTIGRHLEERLGIAAGGKLEGG
mmetsp:Transcript_103998/g.289765  ORF Transcript_103998/g.289765 Transcript_103998/m.289765 type:complete len:442 (+) Transcript_103998:227-1552(+)